MNPEDGYSLQEISSDTNLAVDQSADEVTLRTGQFYLYNIYNLDRLFQQQTAPLRVSYRQVPPRCRRLIPATTESES